MIESGGVLGRFQGRFRTAALAAGIGIAAIGAADTASAAEKAQFNIQPKDVPTIVTTATGIPYDDLIKDNGVSMPVPCDGRVVPCVIQLGQIVWPGENTEGISRKFRRQVIATQQQIEHIAERAVAANNSACVFSEEVVDKQGPLAARDLIREAQRDLGRHQDAQPATLQKLGEEYAWMKAFSQKYYIDTPLVYHFAEQDFGRYRDRILEAASPLAGEHGTPTERTQILNAMTETEERATVLWEKNGNPNPYIIGADISLLVSGKVAGLCPTIDAGTIAEVDQAQTKLALAEAAYEQQINGVVRKKLQKYPEIERTFKKLSASEEKGDLTEVELAESQRLNDTVDGFIAQARMDPSVIPYAKRVRLAEEARARAQYDLREDTAVRNILNEQAVRGKSNAVVIWDAGRSLEDAVVRSNKKNKGKPDKQLGLVMITPIEASNAISPGNN